MASRRRKKRGLKVAGLPGGYITRWNAAGVESIGLSVKLLSLLSPGAGTTYYVDPIDGDDAAAGSLSAPFKNPFYAGQRAGSGDNIVLIGINAISPLRWNAPLLPAITMQAGAKILSPDLSYIIKSIDVSHGSTVPLGMYNFDFNSWVDATTPSGWIKADTAGAIARVAGDSTTYALRFDRTGSLAISVYRYIYLQPNTEYTVTFKIWVASTSSDIWLVLRNTASGTRYLQDDGVTWSTTANTVVLDVVTGETGRWVEKSFTFTSDSYSTPYYFQVAGAGTGLTTHDLITITPTVQPTFAWTLESGSTYSMPFGLASSVTGFAKCTDTEWGLVGVPALSRVKKDTSTPTTPAEGKWGFAAGKIYYTLASGESIGDIHFEAVPGGETAVVSIPSANGVGAENIAVAGGLYGFSVSGTSSDIILQRCQAICTESSPFSMVGTSVTTILACRGVGSNTADGATLIDSASAKILCSDFYDNYDDGINGNTSGTGVFGFNICDGNADKDLTSSGIETQGSGTYALFGNVLTRNQKGWHNMATGTCTVKNNIAFNNIDKNFNPAATGPVVIDHNCSFGATDGAEFADANLITSDPLFVDAANGDFTLQSNSPCIGAGTSTALTGTANLYDADGIQIYSGTTELPDGPFLDGVDIGAYSYAPNDKYFLSLLGPEGAKYWPSMPELIAVTGVDNAVFDASGVGKTFATETLALAALATVEDNVYLFVGAKGAVLYPTDQSANLAKIQRAGY